MTGKLIPYILRFSSSSTRLLRTQTIKARQMETLTRFFAKLFVSSSNEKQKEHDRVGEGESLRSLEEVAERLGKAKNVIVMCGAGLSVSTGIPDFRSPKTGLYSNLQKYNLPFAEAVFHMHYFRSNPEPFRQLARELWPGGEYKPTLGHYFIKLLDDKGILLRCFTQNIDSLEAMTGLDRSKIVAAHGNFDTARCVETDIQVPIDEVREAYMNNSHDQLNDKYGTILVKPDIVFFGESLPQRLFELAKTDFPKCDLLIILGTSLKVHPFAGLVCDPPSSTPRLLINREKVGESLGLDFTSGTSKDVFYQGDCDEGCLRLAELLKWDMELKRMAKRG